jgi:hypothetical protein
VTGGGSDNFLRHNADGSYGGPDPTVSWPTPRTLHVAALQPWEAKIIWVSGAGSCPEAVGGAS